MIGWLACVPFAHAELHGARGAQIAMRTVRGFTLVELMVTIAIAAILVAIGIPSLQSFITTNLLATSANDLIAALNLTRAEAVRCASPISFTFVAGAPPSATWNIGSCSTANPGATLRAGAFSDAQLTLSGVTPVAGTITFDALGRLAGAANGGVYGLIICRGGALTSGTQSTSRAIVVAPTGRIKVLPTDATTGAPLLTAPATDVASCAAL